MNVQESFDELVAAVRVARAQGVPGHGRYLLTDEHLEVIAEAIPVVNSVRNPDVRSSVIDSISYYIEMSMREIESGCPPVLRAQQDLVRIARSIGRTIWNATRERFIQHLREDDDDDALRRLIADGADINAKYGDRPSVLAHFAVEAWLSMDREDRLACVRRALEYGAQVTEDLLQQAANESGEMRATLEAAYLRQKTVSAAKARPRLSRRTL